ncbi:lipopolysaccharide biosynthesis protein [Zhihengliuella flava]|uniref:O-antigen/teichoic acid export membrane protein n=1 Tax=Zhihengliuella flava TaxID=1285193 RepID=A0A931DBB3_9MICC|nr:oligosaccharide flippase family protein [Zhihengliuella flava]MBG6085438.1 O-antigen/teichoic acid export membrane protein [Zhihengliuella flava]
MAMQRLRWALTRINLLFHTPAGLSVGRLGSQSLSLFTAPIIAQAIGPTGRGLTAAALAAVTITGVIIGLGVPLAVRRRVVDETQRHDAVRSARILTWCTVPLGGLLALAPLFTVLTQLDHIAKIAFVIAMSLSGLTFSWSIDHNVMVAEKRYFRILWIGSIQTVAYFAVVLTLWILDALSVASVLFAYAAGTVAAFLLGRFWVRTPSGQSTQKLSLLREGATLWGSQAGQVASARLDQFLVLPLIGAGATGLYSVAATIGSLPVTIGLALGTSVFREFVLEQSKAKYTQAVRLAIAVALSLAIALALASIWGIPWLFGAEFKGSVPLAAIALLGGVALSGNHVCTMALVASERGKSMTAVQLAGLAVGIGALYPATAIAGATGAAVASTLGYLTTFAGALLTLGIRPWDAVPRPRDFPQGFRAFLKRQ